ncbi:MAG: sulfur carrier protein ThiS [Clostridiaceae bacterium]|jgi:sulfur carrier protein|nr:sulfur carrier protein ThiS [Clostridiaceae bacterium]
MSVALNGEKKDVGAEITIRNLLFKEKIKVHDYVTVQVNGEIISSKDYDSFVIKDGDEVEFLYFMGGGR